MDITSPAIEKYLMGLCPEEPEYVLEMERYARERGFPIVDRLVGRLLHLLTILKRPSLVVEVGSGFGYSAYWFARGMQGGKVVLTDRKQDDLDRADLMLKAAGLRERAELRLGDGVEIAAEYGNIDILFLDLEKKRYRETMEKLEPNLAPGALVIADNTLWYGRVVDGDDEDDEDTGGIRSFNQYMFGHGGFNCSIIPLRDGVLLGMKANGY